MSSMGEVWRAGSRCAADQPQCVQVRHQHTVTGLRDSKNPVVELVVPSAGLVALLRHVSVTVE